MEFVEKAKEFQHPFDAADDIDDDMNAGPEATERKRRITLTYWKRRANALQAQEDKNAGPEAAER